VGLLVRFVAGICPDDDEPIVVGNRKAGSEDGVHHTEDRGVGTDADRKRDHRDSGEARIAAEQPHAMKDVLSEIVKPGDAAMIAALLLEERDVPDGASRRAVRVFG